MSNRLNNLYQNEKAQNEYQRLMNNKIVMK